MTAEPLIHSHIEDCLPEGHRLAWASVFCAVCGEMVHCENNECMQIWVETGVGDYCLPCFAAESAVRDEELYRLKVTA